MPIVRMRNWKRGVGRGRRQGEGNPVGLSFEENFEEGGDAVTPLFIRCVERRFFLDIERGLLSSMTASSYIDRQIKNMSEKYPYYMVQNTIRLMSKKFPDCTKKLFLEEQYLND